MTRSPIARSTFGRATPVETRTLRKATPTMPGPLANQRHELFCQHLVSGRLTQADAYREAGFKGTIQSMHANAARLIADDRIAARVAELREVLFERYEVINDRIVGEMALSAFARMKDYAELLGSGEIDCLTSDESAAITDFTVDRVGRRGDDTVQIIRTRLKLGDKHQSLVALAKIKGLMRGADTAPVPVTFTVEYAKSDD